ncbi:MAG: TonB-dependent siderophore receptor [Pseudomonadota bacterium]
MNSKRNHFRNQSLLGSAMALILSASPAFAAADEALEAGYEDQNEIIVTGEKEGYVAISSSGLKTDTPLLDTPQSVSVITREQLDDQALQDIGDILRYTPGTSIGQGEGHRDQITIRGQNTTADFFVDGIRDDVQYFRPLYNLERVEIHKGANALIFGRGGGGGIINRVTKTPISEESFGTATGSVDTFGAWYVSADINAPIADNAAFRINGLYESFNNHRDFFDGERFAINPTIAAELGEKSRILLSYEYVNDDRVVDRGVPAELRDAANPCSVTSVCGPLRGFRDTFFGSPDANETTLEAHILKLRVEHDLTDNLTFNSTTLYADYDKLYQNIFPVGATLNDATIGGVDSVSLDGYRDTTDRQNYITQGNLVWNGETGGIGHTLLIGYELGQQLTDNARRDVFFTASADDQITIPLADPISQSAFSFPVFNRNRSSDLDFFSLYLQDQIAIGDHFDIIAGVRYDRFEIDVVDAIEVADGVADGNNGFLSRTDDKFSPRFGLIYKPIESVSFYASYSKSFLPRSGDQFLTLSPTTENLAPETFENLEIGAKWDLATNLNLTASLFRLDRDNQAVLVNAQGDSVLSGSRTTGFEIQLVGELLPGWSVNAGYSYLDGEQRNAATVAGADLVQFQVPEHMLSLWNRYDVSDQLGFGLGVTHQSSQFARNDNSVRIPSFTRVDAAVYYDFNEQFGLQLNVENLLDETYFPSAHNNDNISTGEPLNARLTAKVRF